MRYLRHLPNVTTLALDQDQCVGCGQCTQVCPHGVLEMNGDGKNKKVRLADRDACMECGACALNCPTGAVAVTPGVGCAAYIISGWIKGPENATCDCGC